MNANHNILQPQALCEQLAEQIRAQILRGDMKPGESVNEAALVAHYGVSRTPVREAMRLLHNEGLLTAHVRRGMVVTVFDADAHQEARELHVLLQHYVQERAHRTRVPSDAFSRRLLTMVRWRLQMAGERVGA